MDNIKTNKVDMNYGADKKYNDFVKKRERIDKIKSPGLRAVIVDEYQAFNNQLDVDPAIMKDGAFTKLIKTKKGQLLAEVVESQPYAHTRCDQIDW